MIITKLSHCCLLIEVKELRILTDPGIYSDAQNDLENINLVLITHDHADHFHIESLKTVLKNNPNAKIISTQIVNDLLKAEGISAQIFKDGDSQTFKEILISAHGEVHATVHKELPRTQNIGFFIDSKLFYPGDAFIIPGKQVDVLALPVAGPWMKLSEAIDYALQIKPKKAFNVHDAILKDQLGTTAKVPKMLLEKQGIEFIELADGQSFEVKD